MIRTKILLTAYLLSSLTLMPVAVADVSVDLRLGIPAPLIYQSPPPMVWVPEIGVYVAFNSPYRLFFYAGQYYLFDQGRWFYGAGYGGPWMSIDIGRLPGDLKSYRDHDWRHYQERVDMYYRRGYHHEHPSFPAWRERNWNRDLHDRRRDRDDDHNRNDRRDRDHD